jgi:hypothetical protein
MAITKAIWTNSAHTKYFCQHPHAPQDARCADAVQNSWRAVHFQSMNCRPPHTPWSRTSSSGQAQDPCPRIYRFPLHGQHGFPSAVLHTVYLRRTEVDAAAPQAATP